MTATTKIIAGDALLQLMVDALGQVKCQSDQPRVVVRRSPVLLRHEEHLEGIR